MQPTITIYGEGDAIIATAIANSTAARISIRARAWQRQLDAMFVPGAMRARIGDAEFFFDADGNSQSTFKF